MITAANFKSRWTIAGLLMLAAVLLSFQLIRHLDHPPRHRSPQEAQLTQLSPDRMRIMNPERIVEEMHIMPCNTVLDIGAGFGLLTFLFARSVTGQGKVFATDVRPEAVGYLLGRARELGLRNVYPVLVKSEGLDGFYLKNSFDVIVASDVLPHIRDPESYFRTLRSSLAPITGRLFVVLARADADFSELELQWGTLRKLLEAGEGSHRILLERISPATAAALRSGDVPPSLRAQLVKELNALLNDPSFSVSLMHTADLTKNIAYSERRQVMSALSETLEHAGLDAHTSVSEDSDLGFLVRIFNRFGISEILGTSIFDDSILLPKLIGRRISSGQVKRPMEVTELFSRAGYELVSFSRPSTYYSIWEFRNSTRALRGP